MGHSRQICRQVSAQNTEEQRTEGRRWLAGLCDARSGRRRQVQTTEQGGGRVQTTRGRMGHAARTPLDCAAGTAVARKSVPWTAAPPSPSTSGPPPLDPHATDSFGHATHADNANQTNAVQYCTVTAAWTLRCTPTLARRLTVIACASVFLVGSCSPYWRCQRRRLCSSRPAPRCRRLWRPRWRPRRR